jgi:hypothetical protein
MDDVVEPLRASKQSYVETEREAALEIGEEWAKEDAKDGKLLRIAEAVEEARKEIDLQTLQDLIDPERKMDGSDWVSFWDDRGFSGDSTPSDVWVRAFADGAAKLLPQGQKLTVTATVPWGKATPQGGAFLRFRCSAPTGDRKTRHAQEAISTPDFRTDMTLSAICRRTRVRKRARSPSAVNKVRR